MCPRCRLLFVLVLVVLSGCQAADVTDTPAGTATGAVGTPPAGSETVPVAVTRVVDGDTIDVRLPDGSTDTVRLVGIDTPEVRAENEPAEFEGVPDTGDGARCLRRAGDNATAYVQSRLDGANVTLAFDPRTDRRGGYDRLLAYVYVDGTNLNHELVAAGHARVYETDFVFRDAFEASESGARSESRGLWACRSTR